MSDSYSEEHAKKFGEIIIQDSGGRMKPANTFSSELLRKVSRSDNYKGLNSDQVLLSIMDNPSLWFNVPLVYLKSGQKGDTIRKVIGVPNDMKKAPLVSFFDDLGNYKLASNLEKAYLSVIPSQIEKDFIEVGSSILDTKLSKFAKKNSIKNFEFFSGIPGTIGGAVKMNSGCFGSETKDILKKIKFINAKGYKKETILYDHLVMFVVSLIKLQHDTE